MIKLKLYALNENNWKAKFLRILLFTMITKEGVWFTTEFGDVLYIWKWKRSTQNRKFYNLTTGYSYKTYDTLLKAMEKRKKESELLMANLSAAIKATTDMDGCPF